MPHALWLILAVVGIILLVIRAVAAAVKVLITVGIVVLAVAAILMILHPVRGASRVQRHRGNIRRTAAFRLEGRCPWCAGWC
jgi:membrane-bound ClpP family serine protease